MDYQVLFNSAFTVLMMVLGWILKNIFDAITDLRKNDTELTKEVNKLAVTLPENYIHRETFKDFADAMFKKLDRIEDKFDRVQQHTTQ
jgi:hypothetical protein